MASLEELNGSAGPTIDDFNFDKDTVAPVVNKASNLNLATYTAALSDNPQNIIDTYRATEAELTLEGKSQLTTEIHNQAKQRAYQANLKAATSILADPNIPDEEKLRIANELADVNGRQYELRNLLSTEMLAKESRGEDERAETFRVDTAAAIQYMNEIKRQEQAILNAELSKETPTMIRKVEDFVELMVPFVDQAMATSIKKKLGEGTAESAWDAFTLLGSAKADMRDMMASLPPEQRLEMTRVVADFINESSTITGPDGNDFARREYLQAVLDQGSYTDVDEWVDNIIGVLDMTIVGGIAGRLLMRSTKVATGVERAQRAVSSVVKRSVKTRVQPTSLAQNLKDANPEALRNAHAAAVSDETGEAAQAMYGASKEDVVMNDIMPEMLDEVGEVSAKVSDPDKNLRLDEMKAPELQDWLGTEHAGYAFKAERAQAIAATVNRMENVIGLAPRKEMFQVGERGGNVVMRAVYGPSEGGFSSVEEAINLTEFALREEGIAREQIKLLERQGDRYVEIDPKLYEGQLFNKPIVEKVVAEDISGAKTTISVSRKPKDILVSVEHERAFNPGDVVAWSEADVLYNIFDRLNVFNGKAGAGSLQRSLMDNASMLHPKLSTSGVTAVDRAAGLEKTLLDLGGDFAKQFSKAGPEMQAVMTKMIKEANYYGKDFSYNEMVAAGLRGEQIEALRTWRKYWDNAYYLENRDLARTLSARGFKEYVDKASDTRLIVKPVARNQLGKVGQIYDPATGEVRRMTDAELTALYESGGQIAKMQRPLVVGDDAYEYIRVANQADTSYLKGISDSTQVLNYRKGYYTVSYQDPYFIVQKVRNSRGDVLFERAIATAGSKKEAEAFATSKAGVDGKPVDDFYVRGDLKKLSVDSDVYWDLNQSMGRSAQKIRGKRLEEADTNAMSSLQANVLDPVDSMIISARSLANRVSLRGMLETTKSRFIAQYKEFLPLDDFNNPRMPNSVSEVAYRGGQAENQKKLADARTTYEYIRQMEDGYINHIDDAYKSALKVISDVAGNAGLAKLDKSLKWMADSRGPSAMGKNLAFNMYLATNPARQFVIQSHQAMQLVANYPRWIAGGEATPQLLVLMAKQLGAPIPKNVLKGAGLTEESAERMYKQFKATGQVAAIDKQNLIRGALLDLADQMSLGRTGAGKAWRNVTAPITWLRKIGFDAGENVNTMTAWLANRDTALRAGKNMDDPLVQAEVAGKARNYTYNMNAAGDMPYNQNFLAAVFQFMQVPHKAMLTMTFNRVLTPAQKVRLATFNGIMYTLPPAAMLAWFGEDGMDVLPEDPEARDAVIQGLEGAVLNKLLSMGYGENISVDWSGLSPLDVYGTMEFVTGLLTTDLGTIIAGTPSGQLFFGNNPRLTNFAKTAARYVNLVDDYEDPTEFGQVVTDFGKLSSGFSNAFKAAYAMEYFRKYGTLGGNTNSQIPTPEAVALVFGFQSMDDVYRRYANDKVYRKGKDFEEDVRNWYRELKRHVLSKEPGVEDAEYMKKVINESWRVFGNDDYRARQTLLTEMKRDMANKDLTLLNRIIRESGIMSHEERENLFRSIPMKDEAQRNKLLDLNKYILEYKEGE